MWPLLEDLSLYMTDITVRGLRLMLNKSNWPNLKVLNVSWNKIGDEGLEVLASGKWPLLEDLNLVVTNITAAGLELIIDKSDWPNLKKLNVAQNNIGNKGLEVLMSRNWPLLEALNLSQTNITAQGLKLVMDKQNWPDLKRLDVSGNQIGDEGLEALVCGKWPFIEDLSLEGTNITAKGIKFMIDDSNWLNLKILNVAKNKIGDKGLEILSSGKWPLLEDLILYDTQIKTQDLKSVISKFNWPNLKKVRIASCDNIIDIKNLRNEDKV